MDTLSYAIFGTAGLVVSAAIFRRPAIGAMLILAVVHFEKAFVLGGISIVKLLSILCIGIFIIRMSATGKGIRIDRTTLLIVLFLLWIAMTVFWSSDLSNVLSELVSFILQTFMYFLMINLIRSKDDLKLALWGHVIGGMYLAFILARTMISQNLLRDTEIAGLGLNLAARMVGLNMLLALLLAQLEQRRLAKFVLIGVAVLSGISAVLSLSRGAWYGLAVSSIVMVVVMSLKSKYQFTFKQLLVFATVGYFALYVANTFLFTEHGLSKLEDRFESAYTFSDGASGRFGIWITAWDTFLEKPLFGHGFNSFGRENEWKPGGGAHNAFVLVGVENGLIGLLLLFLILGSAFIELWKLFIKPNTSPIALGWGMALLVFLVTVSLVDSAVDRKYLWFTLGLISLLVHYYGSGSLLEETAGHRESVTQMGMADQSIQI
jgi:O-antigen ligase